eukprot:TRINITY_DN9260_c0_g4_i1.p1 TRINITY_DN9260_c0_g4~~TRINITY_DN9260_c0_g4_i1.p1  ORF type:complete len:485 (+),score=73.33 TRINITY_DN9260_c0_g4_i1:62-1456(+)
MSFFEDVACSEMDPDGHFGWTRRPRQGVPVDESPGDAEARDKHLHAEVQIGSCGDSAVLETFFTSEVDGVAEQRTVWCIELFLLHAAHSFHEKRSGIRSKQNIADGTYEHIIDVGLALCKLRVDGLLAREKAPELVGPLLAFGYLSSFFEAEAIRYAGHGHYSREYIAGWKRAHDIAELCLKQAKCIWKNCRPDDEDPDFAEKFLRSSEFSRRLFVCRDHGKQVTPRDVTTFGKVLEAEFEYDGYVDFMGVDKLAHVIVRDYTMARWLGRLPGGRKLLGFLDKVLALLCDGEGPLTTNKLSSELFRHRLSWMSDPRAENSAYGQLLERVELLQSRVARCLTVLRKGRDAEEDQEAALSRETGIGELERINAALCSLWCCMLCVAGRDSSEMMQYVLGRCEDGFTLRPEVTVTFFNEGDQYGKAGGVNFKSQHVLGEKTPVKGSRVTIGCFRDLRTAAWVLLHNP